MLTITNLEASLIQLELQYQAAGTTEDKRRVCKHALLELCGWIEEAQDHLLSLCVAKLTTTNLISYANDKIRYNSGFSYDKNFLPLLALLIGFQNYEKIESALLTPPYFSHMKIALGNLKSNRNLHAHTHFDPMSPSMGCLNDSPAVLKANVVTTVLEGMKELEAELKRNGWA